MKKVYLILILALIILNFFKSKKTLHMLQQNLYNENNRYLKWVMKNKKQFIYLDLLVVILALVGVFVIYDLPVISIICLLTMSLLSLIQAFIWRHIILNDQNKKKLVVTARVKRLITTTTILFAIPLILLGVYIDNPEKVWITILVLCTMTYLNAFVVYIAKIINTPVEKYVYFHFKHQAQTKLKQMKNLKIIGITGSYGKTSSKNILGDILNIKYNALPTPRNLNTPNGLIMTVNNHMDKFCDIFIAEMGAYVRGEIDELCHVFVSPEIKRLKNPS